MRQNSLFTSLAAGLLVLVTLALIATMPGPAAAVTAEEMLADPALESRARNLSKQLRCLVCQNQSIDDSDADLARDLRIEVRKQLTTGASDAEILERLRLTYGDYVLLNPPVSPATYALWAAPVIILLLGGALVLAGRRRDEAEAAGEDQVKETEGEESAPSRPRHPIFRPFTAVFRAANSLHQGCRNGGVQPRHRGLHRPARADLPTIRSGANWPRLPAQNRNRMSSLMRNWRRHGMPLPRPRMRWKLASPCARPEPATTPLSLQHWNS